MNDHKLIALSDRMTAPKYVPTPEQVAKTYVQTHSPGYAKYLEQRALEDKAAPIAHNTD